MISMTSTLRHQVRDVHGTQRSKFTSMISIHLQSCVAKIIKSVHICKSYCENKSVAPFLSGHGVVRIPNPIRVEGGPRRNITTLRDDTALQPNPNFLKVNITPLSASHAESGVPRDC